VEWVSPAQVYRGTKGGGRMNYSKIAIQVARRLAENDEAERPRCKACGRENCTGARLGPGHCDAVARGWMEPGDAALPPSSRRRRRRRENP